MDEVTAMRQKKCGESPRGHLMHLIDYDDDIYECENCGYTVKGVLPDEE